MTHPKVGARRAEIRREQARKRLRLLMTFLAVFIVLGLAWLVVQSSLLDVDKVEVRGARRAGKKAIVEAAAVERGSALLVLDRGAVARRVERLPWVLDAKVSMDLPGTLRIRVRERTPAAWVAAPGERDSKKQFVILDGDARVLDVKKQAPLGLPEVVVTEPAPEPGQHFEAATGEMEMLAAAPDAIRPRVLALDTDDGQLSVVIEGVDEVVFGRLELVEEKWQALEAVLQEVGDEPVHRIDVRVPGAPAVLRAAPAAAPTTAPTTTTTPRR